MTYGTIKENIKNYLYDREDLHHITPTFIRTAEDKLFRRLRIVENTTSYRYDRVEHGNTMRLPFDYQEMYTFNYQGMPLERISAAKFGALGWTEYAELGGDVPGGASAIFETGTPRYFARVANDLRVFPRPVEEDAQYWFWYYNHPGIDQTTGNRIEGDNDTNEVMRIAEDVYLHGALIEASAYLGQDSRIGVWEKLYMDGLNELESRESADNLSGDYIQVASVY